MNIEVDGYNICYKITGSGEKTVVILQGWGTDLGVYDSVANTINDAYRVVQFDFPGFGADVQAQAVFGDFRAALGVANVGSSMKSASGEKFSVPSSILAAGDWRGEFGKNGIEAMVDLNYYFSGSFTAAAGVQYDFRDMVFVRAGYHYGAKDAFLPSFATVGAGVKFFGVSVNAAYLLGNDVLKNTLTVGLGYSF